jgi:hypothetical protein
LTPIITIACGVLVVAPVVLGRVRGARHRDRRDLHGVHQPGYCVRLLPSGYLSTYGTETIPTACTFNEIACG